MTDPIVRIQSGQLRGIIEKDEDGFDYYAFKGIPYAEPPIGELRFKDPVEIKKWNGVRDAINYGPLGAQYEMLTRSVFIEEDCLHLNVYTRAINEPSTKKAVMVWIYGGFFYFGRSDDLLYGPQYLMRKDIVLVTFYYRVGVFGFLNLEDEVAPGNQGLKDQLMVLRWIKQNIQVFGGDPDNVTVFGESAGGISTHFLTLSPLAPGLVHKAICQSAVAYNSWAIIDNPKKYAIKLCSLLGKELNDSKSIFKFLQTMDTQKLIEYQERLRRNEGIVPFGPGIDSKSSKPFMPIHPEILSSHGVHIPYLLGYNNNEGIFLLSETSRKEFLRTIDENFNLIFSYGAEKILKRYDLSADQFRRLYYKSARVSEDNLNKFIEMVGDLHFLEGIHRFVKVQVQQGSAPTYMYRLSFEEIGSFGKFFIANDVKGTSHCDELNYLFKLRVYDEMNHKQLTKGTQNYKIMEKITEFWTNFAKYGRPTITTSELIPIHWLPVTNGTLLRYMNIDEDLTMQTTVNIEEKYFSATGIQI